jgi:hypothetical protein
MSEAEYDKARNKESLFSMDALNAVASTISQLKATLDKEIGLNFMHAAKMRGKGEYFMIQALKYMNKYGLCNGARYTT